MFNLFKKKKKRPKESKKGSNLDAPETPAEEEVTAATEETPAEHVPADEESAAPAEAAKSAEAAAATEQAAEQILSAEEAAGAETAVEQKAAAVAEVEETAVAVADESVAEAEVDEAVAEEPVAEEEKHEDEEEEVEEEEKPRAKVTLVTLALCVFNVVAVCGFAFLLLMDGQKRQMWEYANLVYDLVIWGVPLEQQEKGLTASEALRPPVILSAEQLAAEFKARKTNVQISAKDFRDVNEVLTYSIKPSKLSKKMLKDLFQSEADPVSTLEAEVKRVRTKLLPDIKAAALASADKAEKKLDEAKQRAQLRSILLPMAYSTAQIDEEAKRIEDADANGLKAMHVDAVQRRMFFELLRVLEIYRPWKLQEPVLQIAVGATEVKDKVSKEIRKFEKIKLEKLESLVAERLDELLQQKSRFTNLQAESYEKRDNIAFFLVAVANLRVPPDQKQLLYPRKQNQTTKKLEPARAEIVLGLVDYVNATNKLAGIYKWLDDDAKKRIARDREGVGYVKDATTGYVPGFESTLKTLQQRLTDMKADIESRKAGIAQVKAQLADAEELNADQSKAASGLKSKLLDAKKTTIELVERLKKLETQLFNAQLELAGIMEINQGLEAQVAETERKLTKKGKSP